MKKNLAFERYRKKSIELYEYFINTPDVTANELIAKAKEIVGKTTAEQDFKVKILQIQNKIKTTKYGKFTMNSNAMFVYAKK